MSKETDAKITQVMSETLASMARAEPSLSKDTQLAVSAAASQVTLAGILVALKLILDELQAIRLVAEQANAAGSDPASSGGSTPSGATKAEKPQLARCFDR